MRLLCWITLFSLLSIGASAPSRAPDSTGRSLTTFRRLQRHRKLVKHAENEQPAIEIAVFQQQQQRLRKSSTNTSVDMAAIISPPKKTISSVMMAIISGSGSSGSPSSGSLDEDGSGVGSAGAPGSELDRGNSQDSSQEHKTRLGVGIGFICTFILIAVGFSVCLVRYDRPTSGKTLAAASKTSAVYQNRMYNGGSAATGGFEEAANETQENLGDDSHASAGSVGAAGDTVTGVFELSNIDDQIAKVDTRASQIEHVSDTSAISSATTEPMLTSDC